MALALRTFWEYCTKYLKDVIQTTAAPDKPLSDQQVANMMTDFYEVGKGYFCMFCNSLLGGVEKY